MHGKALGLFCLPLRKMRGRSIIVYGAATIDKAEKREREAFLWIKKALILCLPPCSALSLCWEREKLRGTNPTNIWGGGKDTFPPHPHGLENKKLSREPYQF